MIELHLQLLDIVLSLRNKELPSVKKRSVKNSNMHTKCKCVKILSIVYVYVPAVLLVVSMLFGTFQARRVHQNTW